MRSWQKMTFARWYISLQLQAFPFTHVQPNTCTVAKTTNSEQESALQTLCLPQGTISKTPEHPSPTMARFDDRLAPPDIRHSADLTDNEQQPLIQTDSHSNNDDALAPHGSKSAFRPSSAVTACFALNILLEIGLYLIAIPMNQVLEGIICHNVSPAAPGPSDARCKDTTVQSELSFIRGWQVTFDTIPGLVTAVPYGIMADAYGRELVLGLSVLGGALAGSFTVLVCASRISYFTCPCLNFENKQLCQARCRPSFLRVWSGWDLRLPWLVAERPSLTPSPLRLSAAL